ncbi:helix-turn-helix domain-containing protein [Nocardioides sp. Iso805N]|uniref:helix-turn-helix domain-containing protein n=1 Tax=Nocardioides sp. Iso805N TaxID=1283287 RepID=UPI0003645C8D|nr:PucR family transcriptional regulator [Nocardioides sp. Iso805N]
MPTLPEHAAVRIRAEVPAFAGAGHDRLYRLLREAIGVAVDGFLRLAAGEEDSRHRVEAYFRGLGRAEVAAGTGGQRVLAAIQVAGESVWQTIHTMVAREEMSGSLVAELGMAVSRYLGHLSAEVQRGMAEQRHAMVDVRARLVSALMQESTGIQPRLVSELASAAEWPMPDRVIVVMAQLYGFVPERVAGLPQEALVWADGDRLVVITVEERLSEVTDALLRLDPRVQVAQSWSVPLLHARHAYRWARRALGLLRNGEVRAESRVVPCARYRMMLWLAADQALADDISHELLEPLDGVKARRRLVLAETLQGWLETDESAPALAQRLGVHANTVRGHLRVLQDLFGEQLHEPQQRAALILALETALPRWRTELGGR